MEKLPVTYTDGVKNYYCQSCKDYNRMSVCNYCKKELCNECWNNHAYRHDLAEQRKKK